MKKKVIRGSSTRKSIEEKLQEALTLQRKPPEFKNKYGMDAHKLYRALSQRKIVKGKKGQNKIKPLVKPVKKATTSEILKKIIPSDINYSFRHTPNWFFSEEKSVDISIIIPLHNSKREIQDLIKSWDTLDDGLSKEVIYVSDQCPQHSEDFIIPTWENRTRELGDKKIGRILVTKENVGFAGACNLGAEHAVGKYLIFLNADTIVTRNWVRPMYDLLEQDSSIGIVGNLILKFNGDVDSAGSEWNPTNGIFEHIGHSIYNGSRIKKPFTLYDLPNDLIVPGEREMVTGCCFAISKALFEKVGKFNRKYHIGYWEDADLNMRVKSFGKKIYFQPQSRIYHRGGHAGARMHSLINRNRDLFHNTWVVPGLLDKIHQTPQRKREEIDKEKVVIYTAITNGYDRLKHQQQTNGAKMVAFLDYKAESPIWEIRKAHEAFHDPNRNAKIHKILSHHYFPDAEYSLWIDGNIELKAPVQDLIHTYLSDADIAVFKHPERKCIYEEAEICLQRKLDNSEVIHAQIQKYKKEGFPPNKGLAEATVILRRHTDKVKKFNEMWWDEIVNGSRRDQISFPYVANKLGIKYAFFPGNLRNDEFIMIKDGSHKRRRKEEALRNNDNKSI